MLKKLIALMLLVGFFIISACGASENKKPATLPVGTLRINKAIFQVEIADNSVALMQGLSGRAALGKNQGMYFTFSSVGPLSFWMKDMRFPLDIVWIKDKVVIGVTANIPPPASGTILQDLKHYPSPQPADSVLEIDAGSAHAWQIHVGDKVILSPAAK